MACLIALSDAHARYKAAVLSSGGRIGGGALG